MIYDLKRIATLLEKNSLFAEAAVIDGLMERYAEVLQMDEDMADKSGRLKELLEKVEMHGYMQGKHQFDKGDPIFGGKVGDITPEKLMENFERMYPNMDDEIKEVLKRGIDRAWKEFG